VCVTAMTCARHECDALTHRVTLAHSDPMFAILLAVCVLLVIGAGLVLIAVFGMWDDKPK
jgi:hypothetical protein